MPSGDGEPGLAGRLLWFVGLWAAGVGTVLAVAWLIRLSLT
jgi:hypothetical protein